MSLITGPEAALVGELFQMSIVVVKIPAMPCHSLQRTFQYPQSVGLAENERRYGLEKNHRVSPSPHRPILRMAARQQQTAATALGSFTRIARTTVFP
jgi:hypothetical protein